MSRLLTAEAGVLIRGEGSKSENAEYLPVPYYQLLVLRTPVFLYVRIPRKAHVCVYIYICMCIYIYIYKYVYICLSIYIYMRVSVYICICVYTHFIDIHAHVCICVYTKVYIYICSYIYVDIHVHICVHICIYISLCVYMHTCVYVHKYACILYIQIYRLSKYDKASIYIYVCIDLGPFTDQEHHMLVPSGHKA